MPNRTNKNRVILTCGPDDDFWVDELSLAVKENTVMVVSRNEQKYQLMVDLGKYNADHGGQNYPDPDLSGSHLALRTLGTNLCQTLGYRTSISMSYFNTTTEDQCIEIGPKMYEYMSNDFRDMFEDGAGVGVKSQNWKVYDLDELLHSGTSCKNGKPPSTFHQFISLTCSPNDFPTDEIVLLAFKDELGTTEFSFSLVGRYKNSSDDGELFSGLVCASSEITPQILNGLCQDVGFVELWSYTTLGYKVEGFTDEKIAQFKGSVLRQFGSGLMEITNLAAGEFSKNKCGFNQVIQFACLGEFDMTLMDYYHKENDLELPRYRPIPDSETTALICWDSTIGKQQTDQYCETTNSDSYDSTGTTDHTSLNSLAADSLKNLDVGLRVTCSDELACTWKKDKCSSFLVIGCGKRNDDLKFYNTAVFVSSDTMKVDLTTNKGTVGISVREFQLYTREIPLGQAYMLLWTKDTSNDTPVPRFSKSSKNCFLKIAKLLPTRWRLPVL